MVRMDTNPFYPFFSHQSWHPWTLASTCCVSLLPQTMPTNHTHRRWCHGPSPMKNPGTKLQSRLKVSGWMFALMPFFSLHVPTAMAAHHFHCYFALFRCACSACAACATCNTCTSCTTCTLTPMVPCTHTSSHLNRHLRGVAPFKSLCDRSLERHGRGGCVAPFLHRC